VSYVSFTGSVGGGRAVYQQAAKRFIDVVCILPLAL
jgi:acyl-CoA reductase-like NAD-dependent aldehyde dehydrogenase